ncbi:MAG: LeuA family protein [Desulfovibrio sp.]
MLIDTTLREGAQLFGAYFSVEKKQTIIAGLLDIGIDEIEIGWIGQANLESIADFAQAQETAAVFSVWSPCRNEDIQRAATLPIDRINIGIPVSDIHIEKRLNMNRGQLISRLQETLNTAKRCGIRYVSIGFEDISRADLSFALELAEIAVDIGVARIRLSDSVGLLSPIEVTALVQTFAHLPCEIAVHCHNDFGMATANSITALGSGADYADCSILGIGERSGISCTEELAACLTLHQKTHHYNPAPLKALADFVSLASDVPIARTKPVVGKDIFSCESGIHTHAMSKSPDIFEPYNPSAVGGKRVTAIGAKSGRASITNALQTLGVCVNESSLPQIITSIQKFSLKMERPLTTRELIHLSTQSSHN